MFHLDLWPWPLFYLNLSFLPKNVWSVQGFGSSKTHSLISNNKTSTRVFRTGVIPTCRSPSPPVVASLSHGSRDCPASLSHLANDRPMHHRFFTFWPLGLTPGPKFTKRGDDLVDSEIYHPAKFHCSTPTHARDIHYQTSCGQKTDKKLTVTDRCGDNNNTCMYWVNITRSSPGAETAHSLNL